MQQLPDNNRGWGDRSLLRVHAALPSAPVLVATRFSKALQNLGLHHERGVKHNSCRRPRFGQSLRSLGPEGGTRDLSCSLEWGPHPVVDGWKGGRAVRPEVASSGKHHPWASLPACPLQAHVRPRGEALSTGGGGDENPSPGGHRPHLVGSSD